KLHALDLSTGAEKFNSPITVNASVAGSGLGSVNGQVPFNPLKEHNRPALILVNGVVYAAFASLDDQNPYHGWVIGYAAKTGSNYLVDQGAMGHYNASSDAQIVQSITGQLGQVFSTPAYWNNNIYYSSTNAYLKAFKLTNGLLSMPPASQSKVFYGYPESL